MVIGGPVEEIDQSQALDGVIDLLSLSLKIAVVHLRCTPFLM